MPSKREFDELQVDETPEDYYDCGSGSRSNGASPSKRTRYTARLGLVGEEPDRNISLSPAQDVSPRTPSKKSRWIDHDKGEGLSMCLTAVDTHSRLTARVGLAVGHYTGRPPKRVNPLPQAPHTHEGIPSRVLGSPSQYFKYPPKPLDTPTNPFGRTRRLTLSQSLPPPTRFSQHLPLRFQFVRCPNPDVKGKGKARDVYVDEDEEEGYVLRRRSSLKKKSKNQAVELDIESIPPRNGGVYRICQVPLSYTFVHLRFLIAWLFSPRGWRTRKGDVQMLLEDEMERQKYWFEVKEEIETFSTTYKPGEMKGGKTVNKLSMVSDPSGKEGAGEDVTSIRSSSVDGDEDEEGEDWTWQPEDEFTLHNAWPSGLDLHRGIIYHHDETTEVHITVNSGEVEQRRGRSNSPYVFSARGRVFLPGHILRHNRPKVAKHSRRHKPSRRRSSAIRDEMDVEIQLVEDQSPRSSPSPPGKLHKRGLGRLPKGGMLFWNEEDDHDGHTSDCGDTDVDEDETLEDIEVFPPIGQWNDCEEDFERYFRTCNVNAEFWKTSPESSPLPSPTRYMGSDHQEAIPLVLDLSESRAEHEGLADEDEGPSECVEEDIFSIHDVSASGGQVISSDLFADTFTVFLAVFAHRTGP
ncbi:hypothetical protein BDN72DRAFT_441479 [Pluteus cervinus]|uniref:Uncharacterized protein n=1 Tax=Pluteus cervinus TaxID=181527 RepID=A0ACD3BD17_9AGAR|nr:hypothetical protein BDN72DRAFT_441479 [Pluteus cervinus]